MLVNRLARSLISSILVSMGKRNARRNGKNFGKRANDSGQKDSRDGWSELVRENEKWEKYYKALGIIPENEWDDFKKHCQTDLPLTFRITGSRSHADEIKENFKQNHVSNMAKIEIEGINIAPKNIAYYPNNLGWQIDVPKKLVRKNVEFAKTQRFLVMETEVGNISRQEAVSMIPPLLMDVKPHHHVLDMCAAPGSKTAQLVEALHANDEQELASGFVMANDSDYKRSHMLVHQVKRLNSPNFVVVNHDASMFPRLKLNGATDFLKFDRILCDVPCSGDATMRKNVNVWKDFTFGNGLGLHPLQVKILNRGIQLLKKGGRLVYSTCSMNPIENEAVVAAALRKWGDQIKLVNCDDQLPGLVRCKGISEWTVYGKDFKPRTKEDDDVADTVFPPNEEEAKTFGLENCVRVYPHLQNTGGFFITVFEKIDTEAEAKGKRVSEEEDKAAKKAKIETANSISSKNVAATASSTSEGKKERLPRDSNEEPFVFLPPDHPQLQKCFDFYDFNDKFPKECTLVRNAQGEPNRTIYYVSPIVRAILTMDEQKLKLIHAGIKAFTTQRNDNGHCPWRVQSEALNTLKKFIGSNRQLSCNLELFKLLLTDAFPKIEDVKNKQIDIPFSEKLSTLSDGCVFLSVKREEGKEDLFLPLWKGISNLNLMVNKKDSQELLYRVFDIETSSKDEGKEAAYQRKVLAEQEARKSASATVSASESAEPENN